MAHRKRRQLELAAGVHLDSRGRLPVVGEADLVEVFGVHRSVAPTTPYLDRGPEKEVIAALQVGRPVLIVGPALVGKSRLAVEALRRIAPERPVMSWKDPTKVQTHLSDKMPTGSVVLFDRLERYLETGAVDVGRLTQLAADNLVVGTISNSAFELIKQGRTYGAQLMGQAAASSSADALDSFAVVDLPFEGPRALELLLASLPSSNVGQRIRTAGGIGIYLAGGDLAASRFAYLRDFYPYSYGLIRAAVDWQRIGIGEAIPRNVARTVAPAYVQGHDLAHPGTIAPDGDRGWRKHEKRATAWLAGKKSARLIAQQSNVDVGGAWMPFPNLSDLIFAQGRTEKIPPETWTEVVRAPASLAQISSATYYALDTNEFDWAIKLVLRDVDDGVQQAHTALGVIYAKHLHDYQSAIPWLRNGVGFGSAQAMAILGAALFESDQEEAATLLKAAAEQEEPSGMAGHGFRLAISGAEEEGREWLEKAAVAGEVSAMGWLGLLMATTFHDVASAEMWLRRAGEHDDAEAMANLATLLELLDRIDEADEWLKRASALHHPEAMARWGKKLSDRGDQTAAEPLLRGAAEDGNIPAMVHLGVLLWPHIGAEAEDWFRRAAELENSWGMYNLGVVLEDRDPNEAKFWYQKAADLGMEASRDALDKLLAKEAIVQPVPPIDS